MICLIVVPSLIRAGAETQAVDLANGLAAKGHSVHLCCFEQELDQRNRLSEDVQFHHLPRKTKFDRTLADRLAALIDDEKIEIVQAILQVSSLVAWLAASRSSRQPPVVAAVHTTLNRGLKQELQERLLYRWIMRQLAGVVFVCEHQRRHWTDKYPELGRVSHVVYNGLDPRRFSRDDFTEAAQQLRRDLRIPEQTFVFSCLAAFRPEKGHRILLNAFSRVDGDACLLLAGDGALRESMETLAARVGLERRTRFVGNVPDVRPILAASQATVLASTAVETFSIAMLESMAMGVPMIAPRIGGLPEAIHDGGTGLLFPIADTAALTEGMQALLRNPSEARRMGDAAREKLARSFTLENMVAGSEEVLRAAARQRTAPPAAAGQER